MSTRFTLAIALLLAMPGCGKSLCQGTELSQAKTSDAEAEAMRRFWKSCRPLSVRLMDASGTTVPLSDPAWPTKAKRAQLGGGRGKFEHTLIDPGNVSLLLGE